MLTAFGLNTNINHEDDVDNGVGDKTHDLSGGWHGHVNPLIGQLDNLEDRDGGYAGYRREGWSNKEMED